MLEDQRLLQTQQNHVLLLVKQAGLDPAQFDWFDMRRASSDPYTVSRLEHGQSRFYFQFDVYTDRMGLRRLSLFSPGTERREEEAIDPAWDGQLRQLATWAMRLGAELDAPDLWALVTRPSAVLERATAYADNSRFTSDETNDIEKTLQVLLSEVRALAGVTEEQKGTATELVEHLIETSKRSGRRDWFFMLSGALVSWALSLGLTPQQFQSLLSTVGQGLRRMLG